MRHTMRSESLARRRSGDPVSCREARQERERSQQPHVQRQRPEAAELFPIIYGELRRVAGRYLSRERRNHTLQPTALVHEAWLKLQNERRVSLHGRTHGARAGGAGDAPPARRSRPPPEARQARRRRSSRWCSTIC